MNFRELTLLSIIFLIGMVISSSSCSKKKYVFSSTLGYEENGLMRTKDSLFVQIRAFGRSESEAQSNALFLADSTLKTEISTNFTSIAESFKKEIQSTSGSSSITAFTLISLEKCLLSVHDVRMPSQIVRLKTEYDYDRQRYETYVLVGLDFPFINSLFIKCMFRKDELYKIFTTTSAFEKLNNLYPAE